jgi:hypothetical protein
VPLRPQADISAPGSGLFPVFCAASPELPVSKPGLSGRCFRFPGRPRPSIGTRAYLEPEHLPRSLRFPRVFSPSHRHWRLPEPGAPAEKPRYIPYLFLTNYRSCHPSEPAPPLHELLFPSAALPFHPPDSHQPSPLSSSTLDSFTMQLITIIPKSSQTPVNSLPCCHGLLHCCLRLFYLDVATLREEEG